MQGVLLGVALATLAGSALAQSTVVSSAPDAVTITLYREAGLTSRDLQENPGAAEAGLVMVTETRTVDVPAGAVRVAFRGVADGMVPQTAAVTGVDVAEQDYAYDLLTPGALAARSVGETVRLVRTDPATGKVTDERGVLRSAPEGVVIDIDGRIEALSCSGLPERLVFERVPAGLTDQPTLSVLTRANRAGRRKVKLSYLATGLAWSADYVARIAPDGRTLDLTGWLTLANSSDTTFGRAPTDVVAGTLSREELERISPTLIRREQRCWPRRGAWGTRTSIPPPPPLFVAPPAPPPPPALMAPPPEAEIQEVVVTASRIARQSELGDYKLYTLPEATTLAARQVKQVRFIEKRGVSFDTVHVFDVSEETEEPVAAEVLVRLTNTLASGLGAPLPAGNLVLYEPAGSGVSLVGETKIDDAAIGPRPLDYAFGEAFDVRMRQTLETESDDGDRREWTVELTNAKRVPARVELYGPDLDYTRVTREDARHAEKDGAAVWSLTLSPGERRVFRYATATKRDS